MIRTATVAFMAKKRGRPFGKGTRPMRIAEPLCEVLDHLAERNLSSTAAEANRIIREGLERLGLWPPPERPPTKR